MQTIAITAIILPNYKHSNNSTLKYFHEKNTIFSTHDSVPTINTKQKKTKKKQHNNKNTQ
jgi:hypothetical protein